MARLIKRPKTAAQRDAFHRTRLLSEVGGQKKAFTPVQVRNLKAKLARTGHIRDLALFCTAIDTMLRSCDLLKLRVEDVYDSRSGHMRKSTTILQMKTRHKVVVMLSAETRQALRAWILTGNKAPDSYLWTDIRGRHPWLPMTRGAYAVRFKGWCALIGIKDIHNYSTHTLRRTRAKYIYKRIKDPETVRVLLGHRSLDSTSKYLGITADEALKVARKFVM